MPIPATAFGHELRADVLVAGGSLGGVAAALAAARAGRTVVLTEETGWIGGQATAQGVPLDEHPWIERFGRTQSYADFRTGVRDYYRRHYPLSPAAWADRELNPGAGWASRLCFEPRVGEAVLYALLAPQLAAGRLTILLHHQPTAVAGNADRVEAVTFLDRLGGRTRTIAAAYVLDATELGDLLELGGIESVIGAESRAETGEPNALAGPADPRDQMAFTHVLALDHRPGEEHVIPRPRDYDFWRTHLRADNGQPQLPVPDLFGTGPSARRARPEDPLSYTFSPWTMRRMLYAGNFAPGFMAGDLTALIWTQNAYALGPLCGVTPGEKARHSEGGRQLTLSLLHWLQTEAPDPATGRRGFPGLRPRGDVFGTPEGLAPYPYIRESRRLRAEFTVREQDFLREANATRTAPVKYHDSVGVGGYRVDILRLGPDGRSFAHENHGRHWVQQIPLGALIPVRFENLLPACKNLGVTHVMNGAFRLHPNEWNIGEAAGALAAFSLEHRLVPRQVRNTPHRLADFQRELVRRGIELDWPRDEFARSYFSEVSVADPDWYYGEADRR